MVGLIEDERWITRQYFRDEGDVIFLIGSIGDEIGGSLFLKTVYGKKAGRPPRLDFDRELALQKFVQTVIRKGIVKNAHDCSEGGLAVALAEACISGAQKIGAEITLPASNRRVDVLLFNESQSRIIVSVAGDGVETLQRQAAQMQVPLIRLGRVGGASLEIETATGALAWPLDQLHETWYNSIALALSQQDL
jgi:phosphoribosylformylglycinamidine synthase